MSDATPWSAREVLDRLGREPVGAALAQRVASRLVEDAGRKGIWNSHRDYCGHGLIYRDSGFCLVEVHDGQVHDAVALGTWNNMAQFTGWLARQNDYSLSGAEPGEALLHTTEPSKLNNQRLTRSRLEEYASGNEVLPVFRDYLMILDSALAFLVEEFGFEKAAPEMTGRECEVVYRLPSRAAISVITEPFHTPFILLTLNADEPGRSFSNQPLVGLARRRAPDWQPPKFGRDAEPAGSNLFDCFAQYEKVLRSHFMDVLEPEPGGLEAPAVGSSTTDMPSEEAEPLPASSAARTRLLGGLVALAALVVMVIELRYIFDFDTMEATGSVRGNLGYLILLCLPWVVFVAGLLQAASGVDIRRYNAVFSKAPLTRRLGIMLAVVAALILATLLAYLLAVLR